MFRSLRGRLMVLLVLLVVTAIATGLLMVGLFRQSATAQAGQAAAEIGRACDAIIGTYRFYTAGWKGPVSEAVDETVRRELTAVVLTALRDRVGVEGGIWQAEAGSLAYAFPMYQGAGPKTDLPQAELSRIQAVNRVSLSEDRQASARYDATSQILLLTACPLPGPIPSLTGWTMTRVFTFAGRSYQQLMAGLAILLATVLAAAALLSQLTVKWSRHVSQIENALQARDIAELPTLRTTGERELDRIVTALNESGRRVVEARWRADQLARQVATGERLASIGRVAAGIAHEIRNPIAAMRLRAENALVGEPVRKRQALTAILEQIERLDALIRRLLSVTEREQPRSRCVALGPFLDACVASNADLAATKEITLDCAGIEGHAHFDPAQMQGALDNLVRNAIHEAPARSRIVVAARHEAENLILSVQDQGKGPPPEIRDHLFEPFVTGRPDGTGLGLSIVHEVAAAHGGTARLAEAQSLTTFEIVLPWRQS
jgi:signal transduction histidine kinase